MAHIYVLRHNRMYTWLR